MQIMIKMWSEQLSCPSQAGHPSVSARLDYNFPKS